MLIRLLPAEDDSEPDFSEFRCYPRLFHDQFEHASHARARSSMPIFNVDQLTNVFSALASYFGMDEEERGAWVEQSLLAELRGNLMQGLGYFEHHNLQRLTNGVTVLGAKPQVIKETPAMALLDAKGALGALVGKRAMELACNKAKDVGSCTVAVQNSTDWNMISYASRQALKYDCIGVVICNSRPEVAPWGGTTAVYGMNPFAWAIPAGRHYPILVDMCSSDSGGLSAMKHLILRDRLPDTVQFYDAKGEIVKSARAWGQHAGWGLSEGAQRMSGYRDMALTVIGDSIGGALTGMMCAADLAVPELKENSPRTPRGQFVMAMHIDHFTPIAEFKVKIDRAIDQAKASPLARGFTEILMPGERGYREEESRRVHGIPIFDEIWNRVVNLILPRRVDLRQIAGEPIAPYPAMHPAAQ
jgi:LDH2 family malate/lactate/ureidoglycolate dehydrogenase